MENFETIYISPDELESISFNNKQKKEIAKPKNLKCDGIDLWQTPTYITYMCYSNGDGGSKGILYRYMEWVKSFLNRAWSTEEGKNRDQLPAKKHLAELNKWLSRTEELHFYIM